METGKGKPSADTLLRLAELGFSPTWILTGMGPMRLGGPESVTAPAGALDDICAPGAVELGATILIGPRSRTAKARAGNAAARSVSIIPLQKHPPGVSRP